MNEKKIICGSDIRVESMAQGSYISSYNHSGVEFQRRLVLLMDLLLAFGSNLSFGLYRKNKHT